MSNGTSNSSSNVIQILNEMLKYFLFVTFVLNHTQCGTNAATSATAYVLRSRRLRSVFARVVWCMCHSQRRRRTVQMVRTARRHTALHAVPRAVRRLIARPGRVQWHHQRQHGPRVSLRTVGPAGRAGGDGSARDTRRHCARH